jgi:hypothetical protein
MEKLDDRPKEVLAASGDDSRGELDSLMEWRSRAARRRRTRALRLAACVGAAVAAMVGALLSKSGIDLLATTWRLPDVVSRATVPSPVALQETPQEHRDDAAGVNDHVPSAGTREAESAADRPDLDVTPGPTSPTPAGDPPGSRPAGELASPRASPVTLVAADVTYQSADRLATIRKGDSKDHVFDVFSTVFIKQRGKVIKVEGIRLRASGRSPRDGVIEVGEVVLADHDAVTTPYWFVFEDGRLLAWGRPEDWRATASRYQIDTHYPGRSASGDRTN